jgi:hypothetical protein
VSATYSLWGLVGGGSRPQSSDDRVRVAANGALGDRPRVARSEPTTGKRRDWLFEQVKDRLVGSVPELLRQSF